MSGFGTAIELNRIRDGERIELTADEGERQRIAGRIGVDSLERFEAHATLERNRDIVRARGRLKATLTQSCVVTDDPVASHVDEPFELMFVPEPDPAAADEEVELGAQDCDVVFHDGSAIALGEAIADTLALSIDPYPRSAGADAALKEAGVLSESEAQAQSGPFAALAKLKKGGDEG
jgi:uncharacterized metal-binding protein YceD (DUF177 family)